MATQAWFEKDLYAILDIPYDASPDAVRRAYRKLARQHHPDTNAASVVAERRFKQIGEAYAVLSDHGQRREYDALSAKIHRYSRPSPPGPPRPTGAPHPNGSNASNASNGSADRVEDLFEAWSMTWWSPKLRQSVRWGQAWWAPMWSSSWRV
jgi:curved DNA-binding protein CbpA